MIELRLNRALPIKSFLLISVICEHSSIAEPGTCENGLDLITNPVLIPDMVCIGDSGGQVRIIVCSVVGNDKDPLSPVTSVFDH